MGNLFLGMTEEIAGFVYELTWTWELTRNYHRDGIVGSYPAKGGLSK